LEASEKLTAAYVDLQAQLAGKAAAEGEGDAWQQDFAAWTADVKPAKERLTAAIKLLQTKQRKHMYQAASRAVDRALAAANEAMGDNDPNEIEEVRQQLSAKLHEMEEAAAYLDEDPLLQDREKLQEAEKSLRKLGKKKTVLLQQNDVGNSPVLRTAPRRRQEPAVPVAPPAAVPVPAAPASAAAAPSAARADGGLTGDAVANLLSVLAKGQSKLQTPNWPKFNDSYRSYYLFKEKVTAYIKDYGHGVGNRSLADQIKKHCVSKGTAEYLVFADLPQEILDMLGGLFAKPSKLIEDLMDPLKKHKKVPFDDWAALLGYLTKIRSMLKEVRRLKVFHLFDTVSNIDAITEKMPSDAVRRWMTTCQNLPDGQQGASFEKFMTDEWAYATTVVSRVTSPEQALKTLGVSGGGGNAQNSGNGGAGGKFNWRDKRANKNGGGGSNQVPVGPAQPNGSGGGQAAQKTAVTAAGTVNGNGNQNQNAKNQKVQKGNQHQKNNQRQSYANYGGNNGGGGANDEEPFQCRVEFCARKEKHFVDRCDIFPTLPMTKRWTFIKDNNLCTYCLKHSTKLVCFKAANEQGPFPCGIEGCT
jgi:hypothetical protein